MYNHLNFYLNVNSKPILKSNAIFWDGSIQLTGVIELWEGKLTFDFEDFQHSHLSLAIQLSDIKTIKIFRIFNIAKNGLKIISNDGHVDMFVLEDCKTFYQLLSKNLEG